MIALFLLMLLGLQSFADSASKDVVAETIDCEREVKIVAKEGEKSIQAIDKGKKTVLFPEGNYVYMKKSPITLVYDSYNRKGNQESSPRYEYTQPALAGMRLGNIKIFADGQRLTCQTKMNINEENKNN